MLSSLSFTGCFAGIDDSADRFDDYPEHSSWEDSRPSVDPGKAGNCEELRDACLARAGADSKFQESCHESYRICLGQAKEPSTGTGGNDAGGTDSSPGNTDIPDDKGDGPWEQRCTSLERQCLAKAQDDNARASCRSLGQECRATRCGPAQRCSDYQPLPGFLRCWDGFVGCHGGATCEDDENACQESFRVCGQGLPGFASLREIDGEKLEACLAQGRLCHTFASSAELQRTCNTLLSFCVLR